jgi:hypothetical protein
LYDIIKKLYYNIVSCPRRKFTYKSAVVYYYDCKASNYDEIVLTAKQVSRASICFPYCKAPAYYY